MLLKKFNGNFAVILSIFVSCIKFWKCVESLTISFTKPLYNVGIYQDQDIRKYVTHYDFQMGIKKPKEDGDIIYRIRDTSEIFTTFEPESKLVGDFFYLRIRTKYAASINREQISFYNVTIQGLFESKLTGKFEATCKTQVFIKILDKNDNCPLFTKDKFEFTVSENASIGSEIGVVSATDADEGINSEIFYFTDIEAISKFPFSVNPFSGTIYPTRNLFEFVGGQKLVGKISAIHRGDLSLISCHIISQAQVSINVVAQNLHSPKISVNNLKKYFDPILDDYPYAEIVVTDDDDRGMSNRNPYPIFIKEPSHNLVHVFLTPSGELNHYILKLRAKVTPFTLNYVEIVIEAHDLSVNSKMTRKKLVIPLAPLRDINLLSVPSFISVSVPENTIVNSSIILLRTYINSTNPNSLQKLSFSRNPDPDGTSLMDDIIIYPSGVVVINKDLNAEDYGSQERNLSIAVSRKDVIGEKKTFIMQISIQDINEFPPVVSNNGSVIRIKENSGIDAVVMTIDAYDPDISRTKLSYYLFDEEYLPFRLNDLSRNELIVKENLDAETMPKKFPIRVLVTDSGTPIPRSVVAHYDIELEDENEYKPEFIYENCNITISKDAPYDFKIGQFIAEDLDRDWRDKVRILLVSVSFQEPCFSINSQTGTLTLLCTFKQRILNKLNNFTIQLQANDSTFSSNKLTLNFSVVDSDSKFLDGKLANQNCIKNNIYARMKDNFQKMNLRISNNKFLNIINNDDLSKSQIGTRKRPTFVTNIPKIIHIREELPIGYVVRNIVMETGEKGRDPYESEFVFGMWAKEQELVFSFKQTQSNAADIILADRLDRESFSKYLITIAVCDQGKSKYCTFKNIEIQVEDINDNPPHFRDLFQQPIELPENYDIKKKVLQIEAYDSDSIEIGYRLINFRSVFKVHTRTGWLRLRTNLDREIQDHYQLIIVAFDYDVYNKSLSSTLTLSIIVTDVNDNKPVFAKSSYSLTLPEDIPIGSFLVQLHATDADLDENAQLRYAIYGIHSEYFKCDKYTGTIHLVRKLSIDLEYKLIAVAKDNGKPQSLSAQASFQIYPQQIQVNRYIPILRESIISASIRENSLPGTLVANIRPEYTEKTSRNFIYTISGQSSGLSFFQIYNDGDIRTVSSIDKERNPFYWLYIYIEDRSDDVIHKILAEVFINVIDENDNCPMPEEAFYKINVEENLAGIYNLITIKATDADVNNNTELKYKIISGDSSGYFSISSTGELSTTERPIDRESMLVYKSTCAFTDFYDLKVMISDSGMPEQINTVNVQINIIDINDNAPTFINNNTFVFNRYLSSDIINNHRSNKENILIGRVTAVDIDYDLNATVRYTMLTPNTANIYPSNNQSIIGLFTIDVKSGRLFANISSEIFKSWENSTVWNYVFNIKIWAYDLGFPTMWSSSPADVTVRLYRAKSATVAKSLKNKAQLYFAYQLLESVTVMYDECIGYEILPIPIVDPLDPSGTNLEIIIIDENGPFNIFWAKRVTSTRYESEATLVIAESLVNFEEKTVLKIIARNSQFYLEHNVTIIVKYYNKNPPVFHPLRNTPIIINIEDHEKVPKLIYKAKAVVSKLETLNSINTIQEISSINNSDMNDPLIYSISASNDPNTVKKLFYLHANNGDLNLISPANDYRNKTFEIIIEARNKKSTYMKLKIHILDTNNMYPVFLVSREQSSMYMEALGNLSKSKSISLSKSDIAAIQYHLDFSLIVWFSWIDASSNVGTLLTSISAADEDAGKNGEISFSIKNDSLLSQYFRINSNNGDIRIERSLISITSPLVFLTIIVMDFGQPVRKNQSVVAIEIRDNRFSKSLPQLEKSELDLIVMENTSINTILHCLKLINPSTTAQFIVLNIKPSNAKLFSVTRSTGCIISTSNLDRELIQTVIFMEIQVQSYNGFVSKNNNIILVKVHISDVNDNAPRFLGPLKLFGVISESANPGSLVFLREELEQSSKSLKALIINAEDPDEGENGQIDFLIHYSMEPHFTIDQHTGVLSLATQIDREIVGDSVSIKIQLKDRGVPSLRSQEHLEIIVNIEDENDSPPKFEKDFYMHVLLLPTFSNAPLLQFRVIDPDLDPKISFSIIEGEKSRFFSIDSTSGWLKISSDKIPKSGQFPSVVLINIQASDGKYLTKCNVTINSFDNTHGQMLPLERTKISWEIPENHNNIPDLILPRTKFSYFSNQHPTIRYILLSEHPNIQVDQTVGSIKLINSIDREMYPHFSLLVLARGWDGSYAYINITVNVTDENDYKPLFLSEKYEFLVHINSSIGVQSTKIKAIDLDAGDNGSVSYSIYFVKPYTYEMKFAIDSNSGIITVEDGPTEALLGKKFTIGVKACDKGHPSLSAFTNVIVDVVSDKSPLFEHQNYSVSIPEDCVKNRIITTVRAISSTGHTILYTITKGNDEELFDLDFATAYLQPGPCVVRLVGQLDYESKTNHSLIISATDPSSSLSHSTTVLITVLDSRDERPIFSKFSYSVSVSENMPINHEIISISVLNQNNHNNKKVEYMLRDINGSITCNSKFFKINKTLGVISVDKILDFEQCIIHEFWIEVKYYGEFFQYSKAYIQVSVIDENDNPPIFIQPSFSASISLESQLDSLVVISMATDLDSNSKLIYKILGETHNIFKIDPFTGFIRYNPKPNVKEYLPNPVLIKFQVLVHDSIHSAIANISVNFISTKNHPPQFSLKEFHMTVFENVTINSEIGRVTATDVDKNEFGNLRFHIIGGFNSENFELDAKSGRIVIRKHLDREVKSRHELRVAVSDGGNKHDFSTIMIHVSDINDNVPIIEQAFYEVTVLLDPKKNRNSLESILQLHARDKDVSPRHRMDYRLISPPLNETIVTLDSITGQVSLKPWWLSPKFNHNITKSNSKLDVYKIIVQVCEEPLYSYRMSTSKPSCSGNVTVKINIYNDILKNNPVITCSIMNVYENNLLNQIVAVCRVSSVDMKGKWSLVPTNSPDDLQNDFEIDPNYGYIKAKKIMDYEIQSQYRINVEYRVNGSPLMATRTIIIELTDQNDCYPIFDNSRYSITLSEDLNVGSKVIQCKAFDKDSDGKDKIYYSIHDQDSSQFQSYFEIDELGWITLLSPIDYEQIKMINLVISASDKRGHVTNATLTISVFDVNDEIPYWTKNPPTDEIEIAETCDGCSDEFPQVVYRLNARDNDTESQKESLRFLITNQNLNSFYAFFHVSETGEVILSQPLDAEKVYKPFQLKMLVSDQLHWSKEEFTLTIKVVDVNDHTPVCPQVNDLMISENITPGSQITILQAHDRDASPKYNALTYKLVECSDPYLLIVEPLTGKVIINAPLDREFSSAVNFVVDAFDSENKKCSFKVLINVLDVNDNRPRFTQTKIAPLLENAPYGSVIGKIHAVDNDSGINRKIMYRILDDTKSSFSIDKETGILRVASLLDREKQSEHNLIIEAADRGKPSLVSISKVKIILLDVNDSPPQFLNTPLRVNVSEDAKIGQILLTLKAISEDIGINAEVSYRIVMEHDQFHLNASSGQLILKRKLDFEQNREFFLTVEASDKGYPSLSTTTMVTIQVTDVNDNTPQFSQQPYVFTIPENSPSNKCVGKITAFDADSEINSKIIYSFMYWLPDQIWKNRSILNHMGHFFRLDRDTGEIFLKFIPDREEQSLYKFQVSATDQGQPPLSSITNITVEIEDLNDNAPEFLKSSYQFVIQVDRSGIIPWNELQKNGDMFEVGRIPIYDKDGPANSRPFHCKLVNEETTSTFSMKTDNSADECILLVAGSLSLAVRHLWVQVNDNGLSTLYNRVEVVINIIRLSNIPPEIEPLNVTFVYYHTSEIIKKDFEITRVLVRDRSPAYDMLKFELIFNDSNKLQNLYLKDLFKIDSFTGVITAREQLDSGVYTLDVKVTNGSLSSDKNIFITIVALTKEMVDSACVIKITSMKPNIFFARRLDLTLVHFLKTAMASKLAYIISIKSSSRKINNRIKRGLSPDDVIDILIAVYNENENQFFKSSALVARINTLISDLTNVLEANSVQIFDNVCNDRHICVEGQCQTTINVNSKYPPTKFKVHGVVFSSIDFSYESSCVCTKYFGGSRCEIPLNKCAHKPCGLQRVCRPEPSKSPGFICDCPVLKSGKYCENVAIIEGNSSCLDEQCILTRELEPIHFTGGGFILWYLGDQSQTLRLDIKFSFRLIQKPAPLMEISWNSIRSILIDVNKEGKILISADHKTMPPIDLHESANLIADDKWHNIRLSIVGVANIPDWWLHVVIDGLRPRLLSLNSWIEGDTFNQSILLGARNYISNRKNDMKNLLILNESMTGCIKEVFLNNQRLPYQQLPTTFPANTMHVISKNLNYGCSEGLMKSKCASGVCQNGGLCLNRDYEGNSKKSYVCQCQETFTGRNCEIPNSPCRFSPCLHGGKCLETKNGFKCVCPKGLSGSRCQWGKACTSVLNPCPQFATCLEKQISSEFSNAVCSCPVALRGYMCQVDVDECQIRPPLCKSGRGICHNLHGGYQCNCSLGYRGQHCEIDGLISIYPDNSTFGLSQFHIYIIVGVLACLFVLALLTVVVLVLRMKPVNRMNSCRKKERNTGLSLDPLYSYNVYSGEQCSRYSPASSMMASSMHHPLGYVGGFMVEPPSTPGGRSQMSFHQVPPFQYGHLSQDAIDRVSLCSSNDKRDTSGPPPMPLNHTNRYIRSSRGQIYLNPADSRQRLPQHSSTFSLVPCNVGPQQHLHLVPNRNSVVFCPAPNHPRMVYDQMLVRGSNLSLHSSKAASAQWEPSDNRLDESAIDMVQSDCPSMNQSHNGNISTPVNGEIDHSMISWNGQFVEDGIYHREMISSQEMSLTDTTDRSTAHLLPKITPRINFRVQPPVIHQINISKPSVLINQNGHSESPKTVSPSSASIPSGTSSDTKGTAPECEPRELKKKGNKISPDSNSGEGTECDTEDLEMDHQPLHPTVFPTNKHLQEDAEDGLSSVPLLDSIN